MKGGQSKQLHMSTTWPAYGTDSDGVVWSVTVSRRRREAPRSVPPLTSPPPPPPPRLPQSGKELKQKKNVGPENETRVYVRDENNSPCQVELSAFYENCGYSA